jgi:hypothetical protein
VGWHNHYPQAFWRDANLYPTPYEAINLGYDIVVAVGGAGTVHYILLGTMKITSPIVCMCQ